jgi:hypothetical protein
MGCAQTMRRPAQPDPWWASTTNTGSASVIQTTDPVDSVPADTTHADEPTSAPQQATGQSTSPATPIETALPMAGPRIHGIGPIKQSQPEKRQTTVELSDTERDQMRQAYGLRTRANRERVKQVNAYALWCLEREMWAEALTHLEQAVAKDSLAASLHNNLGILYERLGEPERARGAYERALVLQPGKKAYQSNLRRLDDAGDAHDPQEEDRRVRRRRGLDGAEQETEGLLENLVHE